MVGQFRKQTQAVQHRAMTNIPQPEQSTIAQDVEGLMAFAGAASNIVKNYKEERIAEDSIKQQARVARGMLPSEDATRGGYRAAAALGISNESKRRDARLKQIADSNPSEEEWEAALLAEANASKQFIADNYPQVQEDPEIAKLVDMDAIESIPKLEAAREVARLKGVEEQRSTDFKAFVLDSVEMEGEAFIDQYKGLATELKISESAAEKLLVDTAIESGNPKLLEKAMTMSDSSGTPLRDKYFNLRQRTKQVTAQIARDDAGQLAQDRMTLEQKIATGEWDYSQAADYVKRRNTETGGAFMSPEQFHSAMRSNNDKLATKNRIDGAVTEAIKGTGVGLPDMKKAERNQVINGIANDLYQDELSKLPADEQNTNEGRMIAQSNAVRRAASVYAQQGVVNENWKTTLKGVANGSIDGNIIVGPDGREELTPAFKARMNIFQSLPEHQQDDYASGNDLKILRHYDQYVSNGMPPAQALRQSQLAVTQAPYRTEGALYDAAKTVTDDTFDEMFNGIPDYMRPYIESEVQQTLSTLPYPTAEKSVELVKKMAENNWTKLENGQVIKGNRQALARSFGLGNYAAGRVDTVLDDFRAANKELMEVQAGYLGVSPDELYFDMDVKTGRVTVMSPLGIPVSGMSYSAEELGKTYLQAERSRMSENSKNPKATAYSGSFASAFYTNLTQGKF